jgi:peroxiredoxin
MRMSPSTVAVGAAMGLFAAAASIGGGLWLSNARSASPDVDGTFVLDEPGIFQQPFQDINADATGASLPDSALLDSEGNEVRLSAYLGAPLVVNVWFSNCPPCRRELTDFGTVHAEVGDRVQFVGVDPFDTVAVMERFAVERGVGYDLVRDAERTFSNEIGIVGYPVTLFVDSQGQILRQAGELDADELRAAIAELF